MSNRTCTDCNELIGPNESCGCTRKEARENAFFAGRTMSERNWTPEELLRHVQCGHAGYTVELTAKEAVCFECGEVRKRLNALAAVGNPEGLPEFWTRMWEVLVGHRPVSGGDVQAFKALQIDPEKLP